MNDCQFLMWLHERLEHVHGESALSDYMHRLRAIALSVNDGETTSPSSGTNSLEQLKKLIGEE